MSVLEVGESPVFSCGYRGAFLCSQMPWSLCSKVGSHVQLQGQGSLPMEVALSKAAG